MKTALIVTGALLAIAVMIISGFAFISHMTSQQQVNPACEQYDLIAPDGSFVPDPDLPLWLRHQAALTDHCPVDPPWGTLQSDHQNIG